MSTKSQANTIQSILTFWFGPPDSPEYGADRAAWFVKDLQFDAEIKSKFESVLETVAGGQGELMADCPEGAVAAVVVLDQFPRNMYRNEARAFATDEHARRIANQALVRGFDQDVNLVMRKFLYLPFEHSENLEDQNRALALFATLGPQDLDYAQKHHAIIARFGRFPHRNGALGRTSTAQEVAFLNQPGSSF